MDFELDANALTKALDPQIDQSEDELTAEMHAIVREVREEMQGHPADEVHRILAARLTAGLPTGVALPDNALRTIATEIEAGTTSD